MNKTDFLFLIVFSFCLVNYTFSQQDSLKTNSLFLSIDNLNFLKNNEYENNIADGYMLLGSQLHPKLVFYPHKKAKLELGVFGLTYAGLDKYHKIIPTFSFTYTTKRSFFLMGNLVNNNRHDLIDPLMTEESLLDERSVENGVQYFFKTKKFKIDTWLNWEHFIFKNDTQNEEFVMGVSSSYSFFDNKNWELDLFIQNLLYHRGGQLNTDLIDERYTFTMRHSALGMTVKRLISPNNNIQLNTLIVQHQSTNIPEEYFFKSGYGILNWLNYSNQNWDFGIGYWYGYQFVSPRGDDMYQSKSNKVDYNYVNGEVYEVYATHIEANRPLFLGKVAYQKEILPNICLQTKASFFFQNYYSFADVYGHTIRHTDGELDFSLSFSIKYQGNFTIK